MAYRPEIAEQVKNAMASYLRRCSSGGMSKKQIDQVKAHVDQAADLGYFDLVGLDPEEVAKVSHGLSKADRDFEKGLLALIEKKSEEKYPSPYKGPQK